MATMIVLFLLAHASDDDVAIVLLILGIPVLIMWAMIIWGGTSREYEPGQSDGDWEAREED